MGIERKHLAVIGCGVIGLTSGIRLLEQGYQVTILARELPPQTTSNQAGAYWAPGALYSSADVRSWSRHAYHVLQELAQNPASGVHMKTLIELSDVPLHGLPHIDLIPDLQPVESGRFGRPCGHGYQLTVPTVDPPVYMPFLVDWFRSLGGQIEQRTVDELAAFLDGYDLVVNCSGLGARELAQDPLVFPIRGQTVWVERPGALSPDVVDCSSGIDYTYIVPRSGEVLLGGTFQDHQWSLEPDPATAESIIQRCTRLDPTLEGAEVIAHRVGLRPGRPSVRLEPEQIEGGVVIHNYGHGAIGHTLAWGCAAAAAVLAESLLSVP